MKHIALACTFAVLPLVAHAEEAHHEWDYGKEHGPQHWGDAKPEFSACKLGKNQSPIDIKNATPAKLEPIKFDYHATPLHIIDNGHTIQVNYGAGSSITVGAERYQLVQFHFHKPSEEKIDGKSFPMVAHLVHKNSAGELGVVAVLLKEGGQNTLVQALWNNLPKEKEKEQVADKVSINAARLLPKDHTYYTFTGSLTTPPCSEGVTWFVLAHPTDISKAQVGGFVYNGNARPVQPLNGRTIKVSN
ncbi:MAG: carbonic anhydrase family protein [Betaproteobacteria bacterium]|nr:carbonic anhydrase family protein [Betaproteobacteria bacterium]